MRVDYVMLDASARGGIARSTFTMAGALADLGHDVRVVALVPGTGTPALPPPANVALTTLLARRPGRSPAGWSPRTAAAFLRSASARRRPSSLAGRHDALGDQYSHATDTALARYLLETDADVVLGTRPGINIALARLPRREGLKTVALEHVGLHHTRPQTREEYRRVFGSLDAVVALSRTTHGATGACWAPARGSTRSRTPSPRARRRRPDGEAVAGRSWLPAGGSCARRGSTCCSRPGRRWLSGTRGGG